MIKCLGDSHRFGKTVERINIGGRSWIDKPRPAIFEDVYFGKTSKSNLFLDLFGIPKICKFKHLSDWRSLVEPVDEFLLPSFKELTQSRSYAIRSGQLIAIAILFGLYDLHADNIRACKVGCEIIPIPIDLECAFWGMNSGIETFLYPSRFVKPGLEGLAAQFKQNFSTEHPADLLDSFLTTASLILENFQGFAYQLIRELQDQPNRIILRATKDYGFILSKIINLNMHRTKLSTTQVPTEISTLEILKKIPLIHEEWIQLIAGDIPYFFSDKYINTEEISYFAKPGIIKKFTPSSFSEKLEAYCPTSEFYFNESRLQALITNTVIELLHGYFKNGSYTGEYFTAKVTDSEVRIATEWFELSGPKSISANL